SGILRALMRGTLLGLICIALFPIAAGFAQNDTVAEANKLELQGRFNDAANTLTKALEDKAMPAAARKNLEFELDRLNRIRKDFPYTKEALFAELKNAVKDLTQEEFEQWVNEGRFDSREIDGRRFFMGSSVSNLF